MYLGMKELDFASANNTNYLYTTEYNIVDFNVDDNGLWVIYSTANSNHTIVSMLNPTTLEAIYSLNISINHHKVCDFKTGYDEPELLSFLRSARCSSFAAYFMQSIPPPNETQKSDWPSTCTL